MAISSFRIGDWFTSQFNGIPFDGYTTDTITKLYSSGTGGSITTTANQQSVAFDGTETGAQTIYCYMDSSSSIVDDINGFIIVPNYAYSGLSSKYQFANVKDDYYNLKQYDIKGDLPTGVTAKYNKSALSGQASVNFTINSTFGTSGVLSWLQEKYPDKTGICYLMVVFGDDDYTPSTTSYNVAYTNATNFTWNTAPTTYSNGETLSIKAIANTGYKFDSHPYISYTSTDGTTKTVNFSTLTSGNGGSEIFGSALTDVASNITVYGAVTAYVETYSYNETLSNCTSDYTDSTITGETHTITLTAGTGYEFTEIPTCTGGTISATISEDKQTCICVVEVAGDFALTASASLASYTYTETLSNCTSDYTDTTITYGAHTITLTANDGYYFSELPTVTGGTISATISSDTLSCTCNVTVTSAFSLTASAVETAKETFTVNVRSSAGATVTAPETYTEGETLTISAVCSDGYYWSTTNPPYVQYTTLYGETVNRYFTISENTATFSNTLEQIKSGSAIYIIADATPKTSYVDKFGTIYVYNVSIDNLQQFANQRVYIYSSDYTYTIIDYGDYVCAIHKVFCDLGELGESTLKVLNKDFNIAVSVPYNDIVTVDCGTITIAGTNGTALDMSGEMRLLLPFIGFQNLDTAVCLNHTLHLYYEINIVNGESVAILEIDGIKTYFWNCKASQKILYLSQSNKQLSDYEFESQYLYGFTPYILYTYHIGENNSAVDEVSMRKQVSACTGYFEMVETTAFDAENMNETERAKIIELLAQGCFYGEEFTDETILDA